MAFTDTIMATTDNIHEKLDEATKKKTFGYSSSTST